jgi:hypothetical protein
MSDSPFEATSSRGSSLSVFDAHAAQRTTSATFLLGQVMFLVAIALAFASAGTYIGRDLPFGCSRSRCSLASAWDR